MSDYLFMLQSRLTRDQVQVLVQVQRAAEQAQVHLFLAGGAVRDLLGGFKIRDLDFSVEGQALKVVKQLDRRLFTIRSSDEDRQSAELVFGGILTAEISMCRREIYTKTGGQPEITRATIQDDLRRRDFAVNAIALSMNPGSRGLLLDPANGLADIERKELRALHNYSFFDDPIRLLRMVRLKVRLGYTVDERTERQYESARESGVEEYISPRARLAELRQVAGEAESAGVIKAMQHADLLKVFEPHLGKKLDLSMLAKLDKTRAVVEAAGEHVDAFGPFLHCLTKKLSAAERNSLRTRAGMKSADAAAWLEIESRAKNLQKLVTGKQINLNSRVYKLLAAQDAAVALFLLAFSPLKQARDRIKLYFTQLRPIAKAITDEEIEAAAGVKRESPKFAAARESYITTRLDRKPKPAPPPEPAPPPGKPEGGKTVPLQGRPGRPPGKPESGKTAAWPNASPGRPPEKPESGKTAAPPRRSGRPGRPRTRH